MLAYWDPDHEEPTLITEAEAIAQSKAYASSKGHVYPNDHEALVDFIVIYWAWVVPD